MGTDKNQSYFSINKIPVMVLLTEWWEQKLWLVIFGEKKKKKKTLLRATETYKSARKGFLAES